MNELAAGDVVADKYRIVEVLGRGGMGVVYRALQLPMERSVALKMLRRELALDARARARFEREARLASALPHPAAVAIHDFGEHEGAPYLVMELVMGTGLRALIEEGPSVALAIDLCTQLADLLASAHEAGLVHRDLTPENVIVEQTSEGPRARVLDFGLAFARVGRPAAGRMTREGVVVGTPEYLSPEQARGEEVGPATDLYALGCVLHELLSGKPPYGGAELDVLTKQMFAPVPALARASEVPVLLDELRRELLDKRAASRPSAAQVRDRLAALDPDASRGRARARVDGYLGARAARMVDASTKPRSVAPHGETAALEVAVIGALDAQTLVALSANGIQAFTLSAEEPIGEQTAALLVVDAEPGSLAPLAVHARPIVVLTDSKGPASLTEYLRAGAADVLRRPFAAAELARRLQRVARDKARRR